MTYEQKYKLLKAIENIKDTINLEQETNSCILSVWLSVTGDYCKEVAKEIGNNESDD